MKQIFILIFFLLILFRGNTQNGTKRCGIDFPTSVCQNEESNGDITISWKKPIDNNGLFLKFDLFSLESPFVPIGTFNNITINSITIPNQYKGNNFYLVTTTLCNGNETKHFSDTSKLVSLSSVKFDEGIIQLNWNYNSTKHYNNIIERRTSISPWIIIDSINNNQKNYTDTVDICNKNLLYYRVGFKKDGCISYSTSISDSLQDKYQPNIPKIVSVGFDTSNQNLMISWKKTKERDIQGFIIYQELNGLSSTLDTVLKKNNILDTYYTIYNPTSKTISNYRIAAYDYCYSNFPKFQTSAQSQNFYSTILNYDYDVCTRETNLIWNKIITNDEILNYKIFIKKNNKWSLIDSVNNQNYKFKLEKFTNYLISIQTKTTTGYTFFSNLCPIYSRSPSEPKISYTNYASVNENYIELKHTLTPISGLKQLALFKLNPQNEFIEIEKIEANKKEIMFNDYDVFPSKYTYQYYIQEIDSCNNYTNKHIIQKTILLKENYKNDDSILVSILYNNYNGFLGGNNHYEIEISKNDTEFEKITIISSDTTNIFNYDVNNLDSFEGKICFKIKCVENTNIYGNQSISYSNQICSYFEPRTFVPNSFTPTGLNPIFKPIISIAKINSYELTIFNRWGQPIFNTNDLNQGWNGKSGIEDCSNGLYIYQFKINEGSDKELIKRGLINLIR